MSFSTLEMVGVVDSGELLAFSTSLAILSDDSAEVDCWGSVIDWFVSFKVDEGCISVFTAWSNSLKLFDIASFKPNRFYNV